MTQGLSRVEWAKVVLKDISRGDLLSELVGGDNIDNKTSY